MLGGGRLEEAGRRLTLYMSEVKREEVKFEGGIKEAP